MECNYCKNIFSTQTNLVHHQKTARYCLKLRPSVKETPLIFKCDFCEKTYTTNYRVRSHMVKCVKSLSEVMNLRKQIDELSNKNDMLNQKIEEQKTQISNLQDKLENIALKAVSTSSTTNNNTMTKNIQINNFLKNAPALTDQVIQDNIQYLTLDHHVQGAEGYAKYAMEFPFKGRIVCVDVARNKIKYKDGDGNVIEDAGFQKMMMKLCKAIYGKSYDLSIEHLDKLAKQFTEKELEQYDYLEAAKAITMYSKGSESEFCRKIIKIISKSVSNQK
jgi:cell division protein FtsB